MISRPKQSPTDIAMAHPCALAAETLHPRFSRRAGLVSVVLTLNFGYE